MIYEGYPKEAYLKKKDLQKTYQSLAEGWTLPNPISTAKQLIKIAERYGFRVVRNDDSTNRIVESAWEIRKRAEVMLKFLKFVEKVRKRGIPIPFLHQVGFDHPGALAFASTCILQYDMFAKGIVEYRTMVFEKT